MNSKPDALESLVVVGAGGFGAEVVHYLRNHLAATTAPYRLAGVADDHVQTPAQTQVAGAPFLGTVDDAATLGPCRFVVASGTPRFRRETIERLRTAGHALYTLIHPTALVAPDAVIGEGSIVAPYAIVNARAKVGVGCVLNVFCSVGHDASVGDHSVLSPYAALNGWSSVGESCFLGTRATLFPKVNLGARCEVDSHSCVRADAPERMVISVRGEYRVLRNRLER